MPKPAAAAAAIPAGSVNTTASGWVASASRPSLVRKVYCRIRQLAAERMRMPSNRGRSSGRFGTGLSARYAGAATAMTWAGDDAGGQCEPCSDCRVEPLRDEVDLAVVEMPVETDIGIVFSEGRQNRQYKVYAERQVHGDLEQSGGGSGFARGGGDCLLQTLQIVANAGQEPFASLGEGELPG
jgi:hypothetical protein